MKYKLRGNFSTRPDEAINDVLMSRGVIDTELFKHPSREHLNSPYLLDNIEEGMKLLDKHLKMKSRIYIQPDADVDGMTSASILWQYIKRISPDADLNFEAHEGKQHGLEHKIDMLLESDYELVIVPDAGSNDLKECQLLEECGVEVLILDHHICEYTGYDRVPSNTILINNQQSKNYPNKSLCGAGVVYKFCQALDDYYHVNYADDYLDLVALGEIADVMDKRDPETNYLMAAGLKRISNEFLKALLEKSKFQLKSRAIPPYEGLTTANIAWYVAPVINAIVRIGTQKENNVLFRSFIEPDKIIQSTKRGAKIGELETTITQTLRVGDRCKRNQNEYKAKAMEIIDDRLIAEGIIDNNIYVIEMYPEDKIPSTLSGLVAQNVVSKYHRPCLIVRRSSDGYLRGSARSDSNFSAIPSLRDWLNDSKYFEYNAGHESAFGTSLSESNLDAFIDYANQTLPADAFENCYTVDYVLNCNDYGIAPLFYTLASEDKYYGNGVDEIEVVVRGIPTSAAMIMGPNKNSVKFNCNGIDYVRFNDEEFVELIQQNKQSEIAVYGILQINSYMGKETPQLIIKDYEISTKIRRLDF